MHNLSREELQKIIDQLESTNSKEDAYFGIFQTGGEQHESFVKANKQGLELYAAQLLKGSRDAEEIVADKDKTIIPLDHNEEWIHGDMFIDYIEPSLEKREKVQFASDKQNWLGRLAGFGCLVLILVMIVAFIVGLITLWEWTFS